MRVGLEIPAYRSKKLQKSELKTVDHRCEESRCVSTEHCASKASQDPHEKMVRPVRPLMDAFYNLESSAKQ